jgi:diguanylate cyclase
LYQRSILEQGLRDPLTGLANRRAFFQRAEKALSQASNENPVFVAYLDLDDFKPVNDRFGHEQGDNLLRAVSDRIKTITASEGLVARVGGDEFVILFEHVTHEKVVAVVTGIEQALTQPFLLMSEQVSVGVSIGLAGSPTDGTEVTALLDVADSKMYKNKQLRNVQREPRNLLQN